MNEGVINMIYALDTPKIALIVGLCSVVILFLIIAFIFVYLKKNKQKSKEEQIEKETPIQSSQAEHNEVVEVLNESIIVKEEPKPFSEELKEEEEDSPVQEKIVEGSPFFKTKNDSNASVFIVMYNKSMRAKVSMGTIECRQYYQELKNYLLSFGLKSRMSWSYDSIYLGRIPFAKLAIRGKTLAMNIALDPTGYEGGMYEDSSDSKKYAEVPLRIKIKSNRCLKLAKQAIDLLASNRGYVQKQESTDCEIESVRSLKENLELGLVKKLKMRQAVSLSSISADDLEDLEISTDAAQSVHNIIISKRCSGKKEIINLDTISKNYQENETVSLKTLIEKKLVSAKTNAVKCLARGVLDKPLHFELNDYSNDAVKMILVTGGTID